MPRIDGQHDRTTLARIKRPSGKPIRPCNHTVLADCAAASKRIRNWVGGPIFGQRFKISGGGFTRVVNVKIPVLDRHPCWRQEGSAFGAIVRDCNANISGAVGIAAQVFDAHPCDRNITAIARKVACNRVDGRARVGRSTQNLTVGRGNTWSGRRSRVGRLRSANSTALARRQSLGQRFRASNCGLSAGNCRFNASLCTRLLRLKPCIEWLCDISVGLTRTSTYGRKSVNTHLNHPLEMCNEMIR